LATCDAEQHIRSVVERELRRTMEIEHRRVA
jgi:hypothetical protein